MINNFKSIKSLLDFKSDDDYYFLQILQRKKDHKESKVNGTNNNSRLVKAYYVKSLEHFDFIEPEIIELCKLFNARAGINLNKRSFEKMAYHHLKKCTDQIMNKEFSKAYRAYSSVSGAFSAKTDKKWIIDLDAEDLKQPYITDSITTVIDKLQPVGSKLLTILPSKTGLHMITKPFNKAEFKKLYKTIEIHGNNSTNLFIP